MPSFHVRGFSDAINLVSPCSPPLPSKKGPEDVFKRREMASLTGFIFLQCPHHGAKNLMKT